MNEVSVSQHRLGVARLDIIIISCCELLLNKKKCKRGQGGLSRAEF